MLDEWTNEFKIGGVALPEIIDAGGRMIISEMAEGTEELSG